jgi:Na+-translocating ferredoxin:NAD+ oxidoreductase RnfG subunit
MVRSRARAFLVAVVWACAALAPLRTAQAEQFWTAQALLADQFKSSQAVSYVKVRIEPALRGQVEARLGRPLAKSEYTVFVAKSGERIDGYALFDEQLGQHEPISFATFFDPAGHITRVEVVAYREPFGDGIRAERFRKQFLGRSAGSRFRAGDDIDTISGATISSRSACAAVERAAALVDAWLRKQAQAVLAQNQSREAATSRAQ